MSAEERRRRRLGLRLEGGPRPRRLAEALQMLGMVVVAALIVGALAAMCSETVERDETIRPCRN